ncbi:group 1 truncated hemoglobin [Haladaptatus sp. CMAA 1911]|uniref:group I truncated hemoglobin n=1 Tax=unclassified Haladaptatus TaxID=2622732 RepID=UPI003755373E
MSQSVYREIGGRSAVEVVVADFYDRVLSDERLIPYFDGMDMDELRAHQIQFISSVAGGPVEYSGADMREAHAHLDIDETDFEAVGAHLETALRSNDVSEENIEKVMDEVVALKEPILDR